MHHRVCSYLATIGLFLITLTQTAAYAQTTDTEQAEPLYQEALKAKMQGAYDDTERLLLQVVTLDTLHDAAWFELTKIEFSKRDYETAETYLSRALDVKPEYDLYWISMADIYKSTKQYAKLPAVFDRLIRINPTELTYHLDKAYALLLNDQASAALKTYRKAEGAFGMHEALTQGIQSILLQQGQHRQATASVKKLIRAQPDNVKGYLMLADIHLTLKKPNDALNSIRQVEDRFPLEAGIHLSKAEAWQQLNKPQAALDALSRAFANKTLSLEAKSHILLSLLETREPNEAMHASLVLGKILVNTHPKQPEAHAVYGDMLLRAGRKEQAESQFIAALDKNPKMMTIWEELLRLQLSMGKYGSIQEQGPKAAKIFPSNALISLFTGYAYLFASRYKAARPFLENALNYADPQNTPLLAQIYSSLGALYNGLGMHDVSDAAYEETLARDSTDKLVLNNYAYFLTLRQKDIDKAVRMAQKANTLEPGNPTFQDTFAWALYHQKQYHEALIWIEKAVNHPTPANATLLEHYGDILYKLNRKAEAVEKWKMALKLLPENDKHFKTLTDKINDNPDEK